MALNSGNAHDKAIKRRNENNPMSPERYQHMARASVSELVAKCCPSMRNMLCARAARPRYNSASPKPALALSIITYSYVSIVSEMSRRRSERSRLTLARGIIDRRREQYARAP
jgi:hypothetical protein